jgi:hypothetical protein
MAVPCDVAFGTWSQRAEIISVDLNGTIPLETGSKQSIVLVKDLFRTERKMEATMSGFAGT